jgi:hypothetical protein
MSGLKLNPQMIKELLQSLSNDENDECTVLNYFQICQLPDHYQMFDEPDELHTNLGFAYFKHPNKRKWAQIIDKDNSSTIYICCTEDPLDRIRYPISVEIESHIVLKGEYRHKKLKEFKYLISKERAEDIKSKRDEEHVLAIKDFESQIDTDDLKRHIKKWTKNYFEEAGFCSGETNVLNINALAESAYISILTQIFSWYYVTQDKTWQEILDSNEPNIEIGLKFNLFYDYYPLFNKFAKVANESNNTNRLTLRSRLTEHDKVSIKYNWYLVKYAKLRCPYMDIKLKYS